MSSTTIYPLTPEQKYQLKLEYNRQWRAANREKLRANKAAKRAVTDPAVLKQQGQESYKRCREARLANANTAYATNKEKLRQYRTETAELFMLRAARQRAKRQGVPCTITVADIVIPTVCPILGIPLQMSEGIATDGSPSLDKIVPELGYVPGNVQVISWRANRIKNNATAAELRLIAEYLERLQS